MRDERTLLVEPWMTHERLDDQVMMINLETGAYFALERPAADCWTALTEGGSVDDIVSAVVAQFEVSAEVAAADVETFIGSLTDEGIVRWSPDPSGDPASSADDEPPRPSSPTTPGVERLAYRPPQIEKHDDLEELLLLDPIHDVSPEGWPAVG